MAERTGNLAGDLTTQIDWVLGRARERTAGVDETGLTALVRGVRDPKYSTFFTRVRVAYCPPTGGECSQDQGYVPHDYGYAGRGAEYALREAIAEDLRARGFHVTEQDPL